MKKLLLHLSLLLAVGCTSEYSSKEECLLREQQNCPNGSRDCTGSAYAFCDLWEGDHFTNTYKEEYRTKKAKERERERERRKAYCDETCEGVDCMLVFSTSNKSVISMSEEEIKEMCYEFH